ncbi:hypothetical protein Glo7428_5214 (plasmid) [Gloeocapsa sp. PCC 7428]|uniref:hypothetical protein n=1 Tax=Gloeocapsa sp. PCC 7428 TaxID=1173026 RepID=UPI0002A61963|nr:hypothetical protein [Gloeocapsa sp. PCC 7428]AFZ33592.1 hypothetical protein Glo7428_5214 [Gloeocapsa sp. PCC 7428]
MNAHKIETILTEDGTLTLQGLPFHAGDVVEVIILESHMHQHQAPARSLESNPYPLRDTQPYRYDDPTEPVALEDWEALK